MVRIRAISIKDTREAKGMQTLKVNGITKSVNRTSRAGHSVGSVISSGMQREPNYCSDGV